MMPTDTRRILDRVIARSLRQLLHDVRGVFMAASPTHAHLRERLVALSVVSLVIDLFGSVAMYLLERHAPGTGIHDFGDAVFFTSAQLLTVSSAVVNPLTSGGQALDLALELYAITVVASLAGSFGAFFQRRGHERDAAANPAIGEG